MQHGYIASSEIAAEECVESLTTSDIPDTQSSQCQAVHTKTISSRVLPNITTSTQCERSGFAHAQFQTDDKVIHFYTGLETYEKSLFVFRNVGIAANHHSTTSSIATELSTAPTFARLLLLSSCAAQ